jgi:hypothetical protein
MILQTSLNLFSKELSEGESNFWISLLDDWTVSEMRYAFDNWNSNGRYFPKPKEIVELVEAYRLSGQKVGYPGCDAECKSRHWRGYGKGDMIWLWERYTQQRKIVGNRSLTDAEVEVLMKELDVKRGAVPAWRRP